SRPTTVSDRLPINAQNCVHCKTRTRGGRRRARALSSKAWDASRADVDDDPCLLDVYPSGDGIGGCLMIRLRLSFRHAMQAAAWASIFLIAMAAGGAGAQEDDEPQV